MSDVLVALEFSIVSNEWTKMGIWMTPIRTEEKAVKKQNPEKRFEKKVYVWGAKGILFLRIFLPVNLHKRRRVRLGWIKASTTNTGPTLQAEIPDKPLQLTGMAGTA